MPSHKCEELHIKLRSGEASQNVIVGRVKMTWSHVLCDGQMWGNTLKNRMGYILMTKAARNPTRPVVAVNTVVNRGIMPTAFVFRHYDHFLAINSYHVGSCCYKT